MLYLAKQSRATRNMPGTDTDTTWHGTARHRQHDTKQRTHNAYVRARVRAYVRVCVRAYVRACERACVHTNVRASVCV